MRRLAAGRSGTRGDAAAEVDDEAQLRHIPTPAQVVLTLEGPQPVYDCGYAEIDLLVHPFGAIAFSQWVAPPGRVMSLATIPELR